MAIKKKPSLIQDKVRRSVTYCKRKKGIIKKAIEIAAMCNQKVFLALFDQERQKLVTYKSHTDFNSKTIFELESPDMQHLFKKEEFNDDIYDYYC